MGRWNRDLKARPDAFSGFDVFIPGGIVMADQISSSTPASIPEKPAQTKTTPSGNEDLAYIGFVERETYRLAQEARIGNDQYAKVIINVVHPPALQLLSLLNDKNGEVHADVPRAQVAYEDTSKSEPTA